MTDASGAVNIGDVRFFISKVLSAPGACYVRYLKSLNQLFLLNDAGTVFLGPITPGVAGSLQNSQCVLDGATSSAVAAGNNLTVNLSLNFKPTFSGAKNIWLDGIDTANHLDSGFQLLGTWNLPVPTPVPVSVTPNAGTATSKLSSRRYYGWQRCCQHW